MKQQTLTSSFKQKEMDEVIKIVNEIKTTLYSEIDEMINDIFNSLIIILSELVCKFPFFFYIFYLLIKQSAINTL